MIIIDSVQKGLTVQRATKITLKSAVIEIEADTNMTLEAGAALTSQGALVKIN